VGPSIAGPALGASLAPASRPTLHPTDFRWTIVPHTHWDREWYQPFEVFRLRLVRMIDELLGVLETEPAFGAFSLDGQSVILEDYLEVRPDQAPRVRALLEAGRLACGPSYVLPDEFLAPQEALVRNFLIGTRVARDAGARPSRVGYQPDPFGHVAQLPQLLRGFGLDTFMFWRGLGEPGEHLGSLFAWRAPDGSAVVAIRQLGGYGNASQIGRWGRDGRDYSRQPERWAEIAVDRLQRYLDRWGPEVRRDGIRELLLCNGSDHEPPWRPLPAMIEAIEAAHPGIEVAVGTYDDYVDALDPRVDDLPVLEGELRSGRDDNILRGIDSVRMPLKRANERASLQLLTAEAVASLALLDAAARPGRADDRHDLARPDPRPGLDRAWKLLLRNQPHDSISGCSVDPVHREMEGRFTLVEQLAGRVEDESVAALGGTKLSWDPAHVEAAHQEAAVSVVNPLAYARTVVVDVPLPPALAGTRAGLVADIDGREEPVAAQRTPGRAVVAVPLEGFEGRTIRVRATGGPAGSRRAISGSLSAGPTWIQNERYRVEVAADGTLTITDRSTGLVAGGLGRIDDVADRGDEYTFCPTDEVAGDAAPAGFERRSVSSRVLRVGPVLAELEVLVTGTVPARLADDRRGRVGRVRLSIRSVVRLVAGGDRVDVTVALCNEARDHRLRLVFPAPGNVAGDPAPVRAEGHFTVLRRPARPEVPSNPSAWSELPQPTQHTTGFVAVGPLVVIGRGLPEYEALERPDGGLDVALTLLRSVGWLSRDDLATRPSGAGPAVETPDAQVLGEHKLGYAIRLDGDLDDASLVRASADARWPIASAMLGGPADSPGSGLARIAGGLRVRGNVAFAALKPSERGDAAILRLYNPGSERAAVSVDAPGTTAWRVRLDESPATDPVVPETLGPGEILTVRLEPHR
jgi:mannosylglycerate hydrolase